MVNGYGELAARAWWTWIKPLCHLDFEQVFALLPYSEAQRTRGPKVVDGEIDLRGHEPWDFLVELRFRDADGVTWKRALKMARSPKADPVARRTRTCE